MSASWLGMVLLGRRFGFTDKPMIGAKKERERYPPGWKKIGKAAVKMFAIVRYDYGIGSEREFRKYYFVVY